MGCGIRADKFVSSFMNRLSFTSVFLARNSQPLLPSDSQTRISNLESQKPAFRNPHLKLPTVLPSTIHHYILPDDV